MNSLGIFGLFPVNKPAQKTCTPQQYTQKMVIKVMVNNEPVKYELGLHSLSNEETKENLKLIQNEIHKIYEDLNENLMHNYILIKDIGIFLKKDIISITMEYQTNN